MGMTEQSLRPNGRDAAKVFEAQRDWNLGRFGYWRQEVGKKFYT